MEPIKIYLDQKDFSKLGRALSGDNRHKHDIDTYNYLLDLVSTGRIKIFFSFIHVVEALRYDKEKIDLLKPYCHAVDSLTQGHCLRQLSELLKHEIEIFLTNAFGIEKKNNNYPFGKGIDALSFPRDFFLKFSEGFKERLYIDVNEQLITREEKREFKKSLKNKKKFKRYFNSPAFNFEKRFNEEFPGFMISNEELTELIWGNPRLEKELSTRCWENLDTFNNLIMHYSQGNYGLKKLGFCYDSVSEQICNVMEEFQILRSKIKKQHRPQFDKMLDVIDNAIVNYINSLEEPITSFCNENKLDPIKAKQTILESSITEIPCLNSFKTFSIEYMKAHRGDRQPSLSDYRDTLHLVHIPYVDVYSTDKFFAEVTRKKSKNFNTIVVNSFSQLKDAIELKLKSTAYDGVRSENE